MPCLLVTLIVTAIHPFITYVKFFTLYLNIAPGGIILQDGELNQTKTCLFGLAKDMEKVRAFEQVFIKLMRRYMNI